MIALLGIAILMGSYVFSGLEILSFHTCLAFSIAHEIISISLFLHLHITLWLSLANFSIIHTYMHILLDTYMHICFHSDMVQKSS